MKIHGIANHMPTLTGTAHPTVSHWIPVPGVNLDRCAAKEAFHILHYLSNADNVVNHRWASRLAVAASAIDMERFTPGKALAF
jgi:hypothetical protein